MHFLNNALLWIIQDIKCVFQWHNTLHRNEDTLSMFRMFPPPFQVLFCLFVCSSECLLPSRPGLSSRNPSENLRLSPSVGFVFVCRCPNSCCCPCWGYCPPIPLFPCVAWWFSRWVLQEPSQSISQNLSKLFPHKKVSSNSSRWAEHSNAVK